MIWLTGWKIGVQFPEQAWDPPSLSVALSLGVTWLGCEADHSTVSSVEIKNA
jgi:hypothetical protein